MAISALSPFRAPPSAPSPSTALPSHILSSAATNDDAALGRRVQALHRLQQSRALSLEALRAPFTSNANAGAVATPALVEADLAHYRQLYCKLRFSHHEQAAKEKFLRSILGDEAAVATPGPDELAALERLNVTAQTRLRARKEAVATTLGSLDTRARRLCARAVATATRSTKLRALATILPELRGQVGCLKAAIDAPAGSESHLPPLLPTRELARSRRRALADLDHELDQLRADLPRKRRQRDKLMSDVQALEAKHQRISTAATEAEKAHQCRQEALANGGDSLDLHARWYVACDKLLSQITPAR